MNRISFIMRTQGFYPLVFFRPKVPAPFSSPSLSLSFRFRLETAFCAAVERRGTAAVRALVNVSTLSSRATGMGGPIDPMPVPTAAPVPVPGSSLYIPIAICGWVSWFATSGGGDGVGEYPKWASKLYVEGEGGSGSSASGGGGDGGRDGVMSTRKSRRFLLLKKDSVAGMLRCFVG